MSKLFAKSINLTRFSVEFRENEKFSTEAVIEAINSHAFRDIEETSEPESIGWVTASDSSVSVFQDTGLLIVDRYLFFSLRHDVRRVPSAVLRKNIKDAESAWLAEHPGLRRPPKQVREQIRDTHQAILLSKTIPSPSVNDVVWNMDANELLLLSTSAKTIDRFDALFRKSFPGVHLRLITPYNYADISVAGSDLETLLKQHNQSNSDSVLELMKSNVWIGQDFLLWLLSGAVAQSGGTEATAWIDTKVVLVGETAEGIEKISVSGNIAVTQSPLKAALQEGKRVISATIYMTQNEDEWSLNLTAENFAIASYRTPVVEPEEGDQVDHQSEAQAASLEKVHMINKGMELLCSLLHQFLGERLIATAWEERSRMISEWHSDIGKQP